MAMVVLFTTTGRPIPRTFRSWEELGCKPWWHVGSEPVDDRKPGVVLSECGSCFAKLTPHDGKRDERKVDITIHDFSSGAMLCALNDCSEEFTFRMSPDRSFLSLMDRAFQLFDLRSGVPTRFPLDHADAEYRHPVFASDGKSVLLSNLSRTRLIDLNTGKTIREMPSPGGGSTLCFYDAGGRPKYSHVKEPHLEQWDVLTEKCDWHLKLPETMSLFEITPDLRYMLAFDLAESGMVYWSCADARGYDCFHVIAEGDYYRLARNGRFMVYHYMQPHWLQQVLQKLPEKVLSIANVRLDPSVGWTVCDTHTRSVWPRLPAAQEIPTCVDVPRFVEGGSQLNSIDEYGIKEWDLPPRWQHFTPWALAALGAWVGLFGGWYRLGKAA